MAIELVQALPWGVPRFPSIPGPRTAEARRERVLLVEDDDDLRALIAREFRREGFEVTARADARAAVRTRAWRRALAGRRRALDVVVTDLCLGEIDGLALLQRVAGAGIDLPVVLISGFANTERRTRAAELGAAAFLDKPVDLGALARLVSRLASERARRAASNAGRDRHRVEP